MRNPLHARHNWTCLLLASLLLTAGLGAGCESEPQLPAVPFSAEGQYLPSQPGPGVVAAPESPIPDVPRPVGFKILPKRSSHTMQGQSRQVRHVYEGRGAPLEVVTMYRRVLPRRGWEPVGRETDPEGATVLRYTKGPERLRIRVAERGLGTTVTRIVVNIDAVNAGTQTQPAP